MRGTNKLLQAAEPWETLLERRVIAFLFEVQPLLPEQDLLSCLGERRTSGQTISSTLRSHCKSRGPSKRSAIELMDVNDPKFALRIFADPKIEGRVPMGIVGTVRNGPIEWLIHDKQIGISRPHDLSLAAGRPFPDGPLIMVPLRRSLDIR
jgi:hypothetical protein